MTILDELEQKAKDVYSPFKDEWERRQAEKLFLAAVNPQTILAMIALMRQLHEALFLNRYPLEDYFTQPRIVQMQEALSAFERFEKEGL